MARAIAMTEANYSSFLSKKRGLSAESTCLLLKFINLPKQQAVAKFSRSPITSKVMLLQEKGRSMRFDNDGFHLRDYQSQLTKPDWLEQRAVRAAKSTTGI